MNDTDYDDYKNLFTYHQSLSERLAAQDAWLLRHPDHWSMQYTQDERAYEEWDEVSSQPHVFSTFAPHDQMPQTKDVLTAKRFCQMMSVALTAYERGHNYDRPEQPAATDDTDVKYGRTINCTPIKAMCDAAGVDYDNCVYAEITPNTVTFTLVQRDAKGYAILSGVGSARTKVRCLINWFTPTTMKEGNSND